MLRYAVPGAASLDLSPRALPLPPQHRVRKVKLVRGLCTESMPQDPWHRYLAFPHLSPHVLHYLACFRKVTCLVSMSHTLMLLSRHRFVNERCNGAQCHSLLLTDALVCAASSTNALSAGGTVTARAALSGS